ncbi:MAG: polysaccharide biosynthesis/export family protein [Verrucomicrobiota bacterium]
MSSLVPLILIGSLLAGCSSPGPKKDSYLASGQPVSATNDLHDERFDPLRVGDSVRVDFSGAPTMMPSVQTEVKGDGTIHLDFIGDVLADGKTPGELERIIQKGYVPAYYTHLSVTVTPVVRFFYVDGEVNAAGGGGGGRIQYTGQITVTRAIAAAGGFNPFANRRNVRLYRVDGSCKVINCVKALDDPRLDLAVYPGDKIVVKRRLW